MQGLIIGKFLTHERDAFPILPTSDDVVSGGGKSTFALASPRGVTGSTICRLLCILQEWFSCTPRDGEIGVVGAVTRADYFTLSKDTGREKSSQKSTELSFVPLSSFLGRWAASVFQWEREDPPVVLFSISSLMCTEEPRA